MQAEPNETSGVSRVFRNTAPAGVMFGGIMLAALASAQTLPNPTFEVATIKPAVPLLEQMASSRHHLGMSIDGVRVDIGAATLGGLIQRAYGVRKYQIAVPRALDTAVFDVLAKIPEGASK